VFLKTKIIEAMEFFGSLIHESQVQSWSVFMDLIRLSSCSHQISGRHSLLCRIVLMLLISAMASPKRVFTRNAGLVREGIEYLSSSGLNDTPYLTVERSMPDNRLCVLYQDPSSKNREIPFSIDYVNKKGGATRRGAEAASEMVVKACGGMKRAQQESLVFDLTGGLGRDAFVLASAGYRVCMFERNVILHALLEDALGRLATSNSPVAQRLELRRWRGMACYEDAVSDLGSPPIVYLDPMYEAGGKVGKRAAVKKETQVLHRILGLEEGGDHENSKMLLTAAVDMATSRVVVKRPMEAAPLMGAIPHESIKKKTHRFDLYFPPRAVEFRS